MPGLYAFGRQPEAIRWNLGQFAIALRPLVEAEPLVAALERFGPLYTQAMARRFCWRLGVEPRGLEEDAAADRRGRSGDARRRDWARRILLRHRGGRQPTASWAMRWTGYRTARLQLTNTGAKVSPKPC